MSFIGTKGFLLITAPRTNIAKMIQPGSRLKHKIRSGLRAMPSTQPEEANHAAQPGVRGPAREAPGRFFGFTRFFPGEKMGKKRKKKHLYYNQRLF